MMKESHPLKENDRDCWVKSPVFICGYPKSGTTLLLALLDRHPELLVFPEETRFFQQIAGFPQRQNPEYLLKQTSIKLFAREEFEMGSGYRDYSQIDFSRFEETFRSLWNTCFTTQPSILEIIMQSYGWVTGQMDSKYWVEKTPLNEKYLGKAHTWWPDMKAIYILRDPRDNFCSYRKQRLRRFENQRKGILADENISSQAAQQKISKLTRPLTLEAFMAYWLESVNLWERFAAQNPNGLLVQYEDLVRSPQQELDRITAFLGIDWDDILSTPTRNGIPWSGNSVFSTQFDGISTTSLGRYKELLSDIELQKLESWLKPVMESYGWQIGDPVIALGVLLRGLLTATDVKRSHRLKLVSERLNYRLSPVRKVTKR
jgi:hypothetical protein